MKMFKRIIALCLLVMATVMFIPGVLAEFSTNNNSLTVSGLETDKNINVNLYKIMSVNTQSGQPKDPVYVWDANVAAWLSREAAPAKYKEFVGTNNVVTDKFNKTLESGVVAKFYDDLAAAIRSGAITGVTKKSQTSGSQESVTVSGLDLGVYFILADGGMKVYKPTSVNIVPEYNEDNKDWEVKTTSVKLKSSSPSVVKKVENKTVATGSIGKKVKYTLEVTVPSYPDNTTNKTLYVVDTLSSGLDYVKDTTGTYATVVTADGTTLVKDTNYSLSYNDSTRQLEIHFDGENSKYYNTIKDYNKITVTYYATLNKDAVVTSGNDNTVTLHYNNDPYGFEDPQPSSEVKVYTYGFDLLKVDKKDHSKVLEGAEFTVSEKNDGSNPLSFVKINDGEYRLALTGEEGVTNLVATNGTLKVFGLDLGKYYVTETKAPAKYVIDPTHHEVVLADADLNGKIDEDGLLSFEFENTDSVIQLPVTGGIGTLIFSVIGILFMGVSAILVKNILKKNEA